jgi:hypothetical protein
LRNHSNNDWLKGDLHLFEPSQNFINKLDRLSLYIFSSLAKGQVWTKSVH